MRAGRLRGWGNPTATTSPLASSPSATRISTPITTPEPSSTNAATPDPTANPQPLAVDGFAEVVTTDLVVRSAPGTGRDSDILGTVANLAVIVLDGPAQADGYEWWLIQPIHSDGIEPVAGWVATGGQGEVWLAPTSLNCTEAAPTGSAFWGLPSAIWVGCLGDIELTLRGTLDGCYDHVGPYTSGGCVLRDCPTDGCPGPAVGGRVIVDFQPPPVPDRGKIRVTGHFDDPGAEYCGDDADPLFRLQVFPCRTTFVATSYRFAD